MLAIVLLPLRDFPTVASVPCVCFVFDVARHLRLQLAMVLRMILLFYLVSLPLLVFFIPLG
jgi:hypothetical protein